MSNPATQFKKGDPRCNRKGRPKGATSIVTKLREALDRIQDGTQKPYHELLVKSIIKDAIKTDGQSRRLILNYLEGMPVQKNKVTINPVEAVRYIKPNGDNNKANN